MIRVDGRFKWQDVNGHGETSQVWKLFGLAYAW